ncbi:MAG: putative transposase [Actinomycetota bacterium]|nr:putative transposase [Actinomycetota bacterium]
MRTAFKCRAYPTHEQAGNLARTFGCVRKVWNETLAWRHARYHSDGLTTNVPEANAHLTAMKRLPQFAYLSEVSSVPLQQVLRIQQKAFVNFFAKRAWYPRFKSRTGRQAAEYTRSAFRWRDGCLYLAKQDGPLDLVWSWPGIDPSTIDPSTVTVSRDPDGRWYVSLAVDVPDPGQAAPTGAVVGVDLGLKDFAVTSGGLHIAHPKTLARRERNLARYQRQMARTRRGSANRAKARAKVARAHRKVRASRADFLHRTSTRLVRDHDVIVVEDLNVKGMVRNHSLAKAISDSGWGTFRQMLAYKTEKVGKRLVVIDRWYPSSKTCSTCGHLLATLSLGTRHWTCPACGTRHNRDDNAAKNILAAGRAAAPRGDACGGDVRHGEQPPCARRGNRNSRP